MHLLTQLTLIHVQALERAASLHESGLQHFLQPRSVQTQHSRRDNGSDPHGFAPHQVTPSRYMLFVLSCTTSTTEQHMKRHDSIFGSRTDTNMYFSFVLSFNTITTIPSVTCTFVKFAAVPWKN